MIQSITFHYPTCVDHALIDNQGIIRGGSYHPIITLKGKVSDDESVVIDFSKGKSLIKSIIDDKTAIGFDHKLWAIPGYSACTVEDIIHQDGDRVRIKTSSDIEIEIPASDMHSPTNRFNGDVALMIAEDMKHTLERELAKNGLDVEVECSLHQFPFLGNADNLHHLFRYVHGLKDSSAYGCKNIAHGHLSFFEVIERGKGYRKDCQDCLFGERQLDDWFERFAHTIFINRDNIVEENDSYIHLHYNTPRGDMKMRLPKRASINAVILDTETTIEYLADWFTRQTINYLHLAKVKRFVLSEGLQKGVVVDVEDWLRTEQGES